MRYLNFDYFKKYNNQLNENWIRDRRLLIIQRVGQFEKKLEVSSAVIRNKLNSELIKLHNKRLKQFDKLMTKYTKLKHTVYEVNSKEMNELHRLKKIFMLRDNVPNFSNQLDDPIGLLAQTTPIIQRGNNKILDDKMDVSHVSEKSISNARSKVK